MRINSQIRRTGLLLPILALTLTACANNAANTTPTVTPTASLPTPRPTLTPRPTPTLGAATPPPPSQPVVTPTPIIYVVQSGDTLIPIANKFGVSVADLIAANGNLDATKLQIGQQLVIPQPKPEDVPADGLLMPSPTPMPYQIRALNYVRTPAGSLDVLGEVFNPGPSGLGNVKVLVTLQDGGGAALQNEVAVIALDMVPPNQTSPFRVLFTDPPQAYAQFNVQPLRGEPSDPNAAIVPLQITNADGKPDGVQFRVTGEVNNATADTPRQVRLLITIYDADRRVVGYRYYILSDQPLAPNTPLPFDVRLTTLTANVASFAVYAEGIK